MKTSIAESYLEVVCNCPYCHCRINVFEKVRELLDYTLRAENIEVETKCDECGKEFIITEVVY